MRIVRDIVATSLGVALVAGSVAFASGAGFGRAEFVDPRSRPTIVSLDAETLARFHFGHIVHDTAWVEAGHAMPPHQYDGVGPLFNAPSCQECHGEGARGRAAGRAGVAEHAFVMKLGGAPTAYGAVLNTAALPGVEAEGRVEIAHRERAGAYPDGTPWSLREPSYRLVGLAYGAVDATTVLKPRVGAALFGAGLLDAVTPAAIDAAMRAQPAELRGTRGPGRFGWQADSPSLRDQTERALAGEMGLTTDARPGDDCTPSQAACREARHGGAPEVPVEFLEAMLTFLRNTAVPGRAPARDTPGARLFDAVGCGACHRDALTARLPRGNVTIAPYTDLLLHDLGPGLSDRRVDGAPVKSLWRTAPLWGLRYHLAHGETALMHDGRARSVEEAVLWHDGQARGVRRKFEALSAADRAALLAFVASL